MRLKKTRTDVKQVQILDIDIFGEQRKCDFENNHFSTSFEIPFSPSSK